VHCVRVYIKVLNIIDARCNREVYVQIWHASNGFFSKEQNCTFRGNDNRNSLSIVTINRNQGSACDLHSTLAVPFGSGMVETPNTYTETPNTYTEPSTRLFSTSIAP